MKRSPPTPSTLAEVEAQVRRGCQPLVVEAIACQIDLAREARDRIVREGSVVRDMKGAVVPHPAIKVEASAVKLYTELLGKWAGR